MESEDLQKLLTFVMPYGKYKGRVIADLTGLHGKAFQMVSQAGYWR